MPEIVVMRDNTGKLAGLGEKNHASLVKFKRMLQEAEPGETFSFSYRCPRSPRHHKWFFARVNELLGMQEVFTDLEHLLVFLKVGSGFDFFGQPCGHLCQLAQLAGHAFAAINHAACVRPKHVAPNFRLVFGG